MFYASPKPQTPMAPHRRSGGPCQSRSSRSASWAVLCPEDGGKVRGCGGGVGVGRWGEGMGEGQEILEDSSDVIGILHLFCCSIRHERTGGGVMSREKLKLLLQLPGCGRIKFSNA